MAMQGSVIEGTVKDIIAQLAQMPPGEHVRAIVGRPSLTPIARRLQAVAAANGMTDAIHDELLATMKHGD